MSFGQGHEGHCAAGPYSCSPEANKNWIDSRRTGGGEPINPILFASLLPNAEGGLAAEANKNSGEMLRRHIVFTQGVNTILAAASIDTRRYMHSIYPPGVNLAADTLWAATNFVLHQRCNTVSLKRHRSLWPPHKVSCREFPRSCIKMTPGVILILDLGNVWRLHTVFTPGVNTVLPPHSRPLSSYTHPPPQLVTAAKLLAMRVTNLVVWWVENSGSGGEPGGHLYTILRIVEQGPPILTAAPRDLPPPYLFDPGGRISIRRQIVFYWAQRAQ